MSCQRRLCFRPHKSRACKLCALPSCRCSSNCHLIHCCPMSFHSIPHWTRRLIPSFRSNFLHWKFPNCHGWIPSRCFRNFHRNRWNRKVRSILIPRFRSTGFHPNRCFHFLRCRRTRKAQNFRSVRSRCFPNSRRNRWNRTARWIQNPRSRSTDFHQSRCFRSPRCRRTRRVQNQNFRSARSRWIHCPRCRKNRTAPNSRSPQNRRCRN